MPDERSTWSRTARVARRARALPGLTALALLAWGCAALPALPNVRCPTMGGRQLWVDEWVAEGWRVQQSVITGHHRLLDADDVRRAWGTARSCLRRWRALRSPVPAGGHLVVLVHGLIRSRHSLDTLAEHLRRAGYRTASIQYPSLVHDFPECREDLRRAIARTIAQTRPERVSFAGHSMGALLLRDLLGREDSDPAALAAHDWTGAERGRFAMIFPPNQGAHLADRWHGQWWYRGLLGPAAQSLTRETVRELPFPRLPFGIVAGGRGDGRGRSRLVPGDDDGTVGVAETRLPGAQDFIVLDVGHTFGLDDRRVCEAVERFLATGRFPRGEASPEGGQSPSSPGRDAPEAAGQKSEG